ncbi:MAG: hypothetical protein V1492_02810 [Candidatus Micrarchaeota archaeon]
MKKAKVLEPEVIGKPPRDTFYDGLPKSTLLQRLEQRSRLFRSAVILFETITRTRGWDYSDRIQPKAAKKENVLEPDEITKDGTLVFLASEKLYRRYPLPIARAIDRLGDFLLVTKIRIENLFIDRHKRAMEATEKTMKRYIEEYGPAEEPIIMARREKKEKEPSP